MLISDVEAEIIIALEAKIADVADAKTQRNISEIFAKPSGVNLQWLIVSVCLQVALDVWLGRESLAAYIAVVWLDVLVQTLVESQQALYLEILLAESALERAVSRMGDQMAREVLLGLESLVAL